LENRRGEDDEMSRGMWKAVEANTGKVRMAEIEGERSKGRSRKKTRGERKEKEAEKRKNSRSKKGSGRMGNMG